MTEEEARDALADWATRHKQRDALIRQAVAAGVTKYQVHQITGLARTTVDSILATGGNMRTYTAVIDTDHAISVVVSDEVGDRAAMPAVPLGPEDDLRGHAERFLPIEGWHLTGTWETTDGVLRAPVKRGPRVGDPEMRDAIVKGTAQYILRGDAHTKNPAHTEAQILAHVRYELRGAEAESYTFPADTPESIATAAQELARDVQDRDPHWDQWAFGH